MVTRNKHIAKLQAGYLFPEINRRKQEFLKNNPDAKLISLGIGDTTEPLTPAIVQGLKDEVNALSTAEGYSGYGSEVGSEKLRSLIAKHVYSDLVSADDIIMSDGAKPDTGRLQLLFGSDTRIAVQDPAYPVYVDSAVMMGQTGDYNADTEQFDNMIYMPCTADNNFFPDLEAAKDADVIFFCAPNNPTGSVATKEQLQTLVNFAKEHKQIIVFDAAYSQFISDPELPKSIFEIDGAKEVAIEVNSLSKPAGFTGVRCGWTVICGELQFEDGSSVKKDWIRIMSTVFNGASNIVQQGAIAAFSEQGRKEMNDTIAYYLENAKIIKQGLESIGYECHGGDHAPYIWAKSKEADSWNAFETILTKAHVVCTPGVGFGKSGQGYVRFSAFGHREDVKEAVERIKSL